MIRKCLLALVAAFAVVAQGANAYAPGLRAGRDPASLPPVIYTPGVTYPPAVVSAGLQAVWDLHTATWARTALTPWSSYTLPTGITKSVGIPPNQLEPAAINATSGTNSLNAIDLTGASLVIYNAGTTVSVTDFYSADAKGYRLVNIGQTEGGNQEPCTPGDFHASYGTFDWTNLKNGLSNTLGNNGCVGGLYFDHVKFHNANNGYVVTNATTQSFTWVYADEFGQNPKSSNVYPNCYTSGKAHMEAFKPNGGIANYDHFLLDPSNGPAANSCYGDYTALMFFDATAVPNTALTATISNSVITGVTYINSAPPPNDGILSPFQMKCIVLQQNSATFTGTISGTTMTVTGTSGTINIGDQVLGSGASAPVAYTHVLAQLTGTTGKDGTYTIGPSQSGTVGTSTDTNSDPQTATLTISNSVVEGVPQSGGGTKYNIIANEARLYLTNVVGTFNANDYITTTGGTAVGYVAQWHQPVNELWVTPLANSGSDAYWAGNGVFAGHLTGPSGSADIVRAPVGSCKIVDGGGNWDMDSNLPVVFTH